MKHKLAALLAAFCLAATSLGALAPSASAASTCSFTTTAGSYTSSVWNANCPNVQAKITFYYTTSNVTYKGNKVSAQNMSVATAATTMVTSRCGDIWLPGVTSPTEVCF
ncbi:MAG: hypothetical protein LBI33_09070 [Propionibacteriaceae bacterium]|jgi:hypothetical protein|nr:hypothetical protein [Propionibacteriaceae bacterium]